MYHAITYTLNKALQKRNVHNSGCKISGYDEAIAQHILKKFLLLVHFLDHAKTARLIDHDPCLFCKDAEFKVENAKYDVGIEGVGSWSILQLNRSRRLNLKRYRLQRAFVYFIS